MMTPEEIRAFLESRGLFRFATPLSRDSLKDNGSGGFKGVANVMGRMDSYGSVIFPGAFRSTLKTFVDSGTILEGHNWYDRAIGMPLSAEEVGRELVIDVEWHDDTNSQDIRKQVNKRLSAGKSVELSVGFWPNYEQVAEFSNGKDLLDFAKGKGYDLSQFDTDIAQHKSYCWAIQEVSNLAEVSVVHRGANVGSRVVEARSAITVLSSGSALAASLPEHLDMVRAAIQGVTERVRGVRALRVQDGRDLGADQAKQLRELAELILSEIPAVDDASADSSDQLQRLRLLQLKSSLNTLQEITR